MGFNSGFKGLNIYRFESIVERLSGRSVVFVSLSLHFRRVSAGSGCRAPPVATLATPDVFMALFCRQPQRINWLFFLAIRIKFVMCVRLFVCCR